MMSEDKESSSLDRRAFYYREVIWCVRIRTFGLLNF